MTIPSFNYPTRIQTAKPPLTDSPLAPSSLISTLQIQLNNGYWTSLVLFSNSLYSPPDIISCSDLKIANVFATDPHITFRHRLEKRNLCQGGTHQRCGEGRVLQTQSHFVVSLPRSPNSTELLRLWNRFRSGGSGFTKPVKMEEVWD
jgi:hypothetical protein